MPKRLLGLIWTTRAPLGSETEALACLSRQEVMVLTLGSNFEFIRAKTEEKGLAYMLILSCKNEVEFSATFSRTNLLVEKLDQRGNIVCSQVLKSAQDLVLTRELREGLSFRVHPQVSGLMLSVRLISLPAGDLVLGLCCKNRF